MAVLHTLGGDTTWPSPKRIQKTNTEKTQKDIGGYGTHNKNNKIKSHRTATLTESKCKYVNMQIDKQILY